MRLTTRQRFTDCQKGATVIEFALIATVLLTFLVGFFELGLLFFANTVLEGATNLGARISRTGNIPDGVDPEDYIRGVIRQRAATLLDPARITIEITSYGGYENIGQPEQCFIGNCTTDTTGAGEFEDANGNGHWDADQGRTDDSGGRSSVVLYKATYPWEMFTPLIGNLMTNGSGVFTITAITAVKNN